MEGTLQALDRRLDDGVGGIERRLDEVLVVLQEMNSRVTRTAGRVDRLEHSVAVLREWREGEQTARQSLRQRSLTRRDALWLALMTGAWTALLQGAGHVVQQVGGR